MEASGNQAVISEFLEAADRRDFEAMGRLAHDDIVMEWPQSGERFRGRDNALGAVTSQEQKPEIAGEPRVIGSGDVWVVMMPLRYGEEIHHYVGVLEIEDGKIRRTTEYFGAPFPAQDFRSKYLDRG
jgi:ketosteroid isomerase-like protein